MKTATSTVSKFGSLDLEADPSMDISNQQSESFKSWPHEVPLPQSNNFVLAFLSFMRETFFPDDPFRQFKNQPKYQQCFLSLQYLFPILSWMPHYNLIDLKSDLVSGLTIASLSIPQGIAYAKIANLPPVIGLYSSFIPPLVYCVMGSSREIAAGPSAILSLVLGIMLRSVVDPTKDPALYLSVAFTSTFFAGIFQASLGILRLGFLVDFLSHATVLGFVSGVAIIICLQQLKGMLGMAHFTNKADILSVVQAVFHRHDEWSWRPILIAICFASFLLTTKYLSKRRKLFFWVAAAAPFISILLTTFFVWLTRADKHGLKIVGHLQEGINPISLHKIFFHGEYFLKSIKIGLVSAMVSLMEAIAVGRTFASVKGYHIDSNKEMVAIGVMNLIGSCTSCYATTGAMSKTAVNFSAGCRTAFSNILLAMMILMTLLVLMPLFHFTPNVILSTIIFCAVVSLVEPIEALNIWKVDKVDFLAFLGAFLGVLFISIPIGLGIAVGLSVLRILLTMARPQTSVLGQLPGTLFYRSTTQYPDVNRIKGILIIRVDAAIIFCNANYIRERILRWVDEEEIQSEFVLLDMSAVTTIDTTGIHALTDARRALAIKGIRIALADPSAGVLKKLYATSSMVDVCEKWVFLSVGQAVEACTLLLSC